jgi:UDP-N-acetylglucosamine 4,6-dehydratase/5-epimerase
VKGKVILITGGSGSFGNAFVKRVLPMQPAKIIIYSRGEQLQEQMARHFNDPCLRYFIGDIRDRDRLDLAMYGVDICVHAAALKIVPTCEYNPFEAVMTNINGAENVCRSALAAGVKQVVALSTDKAVNPLNLYGATKLAAEKIFVAANNISAGRTHYSVVRYGNVVGSRGSVVPLFKSLFSRNLPLTITDQRMTRFWMTLDQAVDFVLSSLQMMHGREIFVPKIPSMHIMDLAETIDPGGTRKIVGIRPGEKLHECLLTEDESSFALEAWDRYIINPDASISNNTKAGFRFASDTNDKWLHVDDLRKIL